MPAGAAANRAALFRRGNRDGGSGVFFFLFGFCGCLLFCCFSVGLQKYKPLLSPRNLNAYRVSISADVGASVFLFTPSLIYRNLAGHRRSISKEIREAVCPLARTNTPPISPLSCHASLCKPACCSCGLWSCL